MTRTYAQLVEEAQEQLSNRSAGLREALNQLYDRATTTEDSARRLQQRDLLAPYAREIAYVNGHITVDRRKIDEATEAYERVAEVLVRNLEWNEEDIRVFPQGSASTQTLIRSSDGSKFDIDAVCRVNRSRIDEHDPIAFFDAVGQAIEELGAERKKRCWRINETNTDHYLEFTPSVPFGRSLEATMESLGLRRRPAAGYEESALAVVDTPSESWKTSNPEGFANWVNQQSGRRLLREVMLSEDSGPTAMKGAEPVPNQEVDLSDTLRIAIRLFKRHRDMLVRRNVLEAEEKPISVILVTLLTSCYEGLAHQGRVYDHPIELLIDLAELMPNMVEIRQGQYWVANPTVEGENFAERWNEDDGARKRAFDVWTGGLHADLVRILKCHDEANLREVVRDVFGCTTPRPGSGDGSDGAGLGLKEPRRPRPAPKTQGLS